MTHPLKIAIVGSGISGLSCAHYLSKVHDVTVFEANDYLGGHTNTEDIKVNGESFAINTGFIVYNDWTYPNFIKLLDELNVATEASDMSFSVSCKNTGLEYSGSSFGSLFAQPKNLLSLAHWRMLKDIVRFNKEAKEALQNETLLDGTLGEFIATKGYGNRFRDKYIVPMAAAIWSASNEVILAFPLRFFLRFFNNHGLLNIEDRPQWRVVSGGSRSYIAPLCERFKDQIHLNTAVSRITRHTDSVTLHFKGNRPPQHFDKVVLACHSDQALEMLDQPTDDELNILGAIPYQANDVVLHTDESVMPKQRKAWASWNYHIPQHVTQSATVSYYMNQLQNFKVGSPDFFVSLNQGQYIDETKIIKRFNYYHPVFSADGTAAQGQKDRINGHHNTYYCGAYWRNGFHEDGVVSAIDVAKLLGCGP